MVGIFSYDFIWITTALPCPAVQNVKFPLCPMLKYQTTLSGVEILQKGVDVEEGSDLFDDDLNLFANNNLSRPTGPTFHPFFSFTSIFKKIHVIFVVASSKWWCFWLWWCCSCQYWLFMALETVQAPPNPILTMLKLQPKPGKPNPTQLNSAQTN